MKKAAFGEVIYQVNPSQGVANFREKPMRRPFLKNLALLP
jgi:hypothetical protein